MHRRTRGTLWILAVILLLLAVAILPPLSSFDAPAPEINLALRNAQGGYSLSAINLVLSAKGWGAELPLLGARS